MLDLYHGTVEGNDSKPSSDLNPLASSHDIAKIELQLQGKYDGRTVTLNTAETKPREIGTGEQWTELAVEGTAMGDSMRVTIFIPPAANSPRGGAIKLDDATLKAVRT